MGKVTNTKKRDDNVAMSLRVCDKDQKNHGDSPPIVRGVWTSTASMRSRDISVNKIIEGC